MGASAAQDVIRLRRATNACSGGVWHYEGSGEHIVENELAEFEHLDAMDIDLDGVLSIPELEHFLRAFGECSFSEDDAQDLWEELSRLRAEDPDPNRSGCDTGSSLAQTQGQWPVITEKNNFWYIYALYGILPKKLDLPKKLASPKNEDTQRQTGGGQEQEDTQSHSYGAGYTGWFDAKPHLRL